MAYKDPEKRREYKRKWYLEHKAALQEYHQKNHRETVAKKKEYINNLKKSPCMDCGRSYPPYCMDFDHREGVTKDREISGLIHYGGWNRLLEEVKKCDLVCAICHRIRTQERIVSRMSPITREYAKDHSLDTDIQA
jgi:hypothetical protein